MRKLLAVQDKPSTHGWLMLERLIELRCSRCGHTWTPRKKIIKRCPKCKSRQWFQKALSTRSGD